MKKSNGWMIGILILVTLISSCGKPVQTKVESPASNNGAAQDSGVSSTTATQAALPDNYTISNLKTA